MVLTCDHSPMTSYLKFHNNICYTPYLLRQIELFKVLECPLVPECQRFIVDLVLLFYSRAMGPY